MSVKLAAQVLSHRVGAIMGWIARNAPDKMPPEAEGTSKFILFADKLFDSVNGSTVSAPNQKQLRAFVSETSPHAEFWMEAKVILKNIFFKKADNRFFVPPTVRNWLVTIEGFEALWKKVKACGMQHLVPRNFNQDPLENFFGNVRMHGVQNTNQTPASFRHSFKTLVINNYSSAQSPGVNCELDNCDPVLDSLQRLLSSDNIERRVDIEDTGEYPRRTVPTPLAALQHAYIVSTMAKKVLKRMDCKVCKKDLLSEVVLADHELLEARTYCRDSLLQPNTTFIKLFGASVAVIHQVLVANGTKPGIEKFLILQLNKLNIVTRLCVKNTNYLTYLSEF
ncbi:uncharacterized protein [Onthophagus taurus]|uniref:uncharacterized protein n=1 Tax=Onthophagus taurus TaxID=166361 RepID=UPI0039BECF0A